MPRFTATVMSDTPVETHAAMRRSGLNVSLLRFMQTTKGGARPARVLTATVEAPDRAAALEQVRRAVGDGPEISIAPADG